MEVGEVVEVDANRLKALKKAKENLESRRSSEKEKQGWREGE